MVVVLGLYLYLCEVWIVYVFGVMGSEVVFILSVWICWLLFLVIMVIWIGKLVVIINDLDFLVLSMIFDMVCLLDIFIGIVVLGGCLGFVVVNLNIFIGSKLENVFLGVVWNWVIICLLVFFVLMVVFELLIELEIILWGCFWSIRVLFIIFDNELFFIINYWC